MLYLSAKNNVNVYKGLDKILFSIDMMLILSIYHYIYIITSGPETNMYYMVAGSKQTFALQK